MAEEQGGRGGADGSARSRERQYASLAELALLALRETDLDVVLQSAADQLRSSLGCDLTKIIDARVSGSGLLVRAGAGWPDGVVGRREVPEGGQSQAGYTVGLGQPVIVTDVRQEQRFEVADVLLENGVRSGVSVVIGGEREPFGVLQADSREPGAFSLAEVPILQAYARVLSIAIQQHEREQLSADFAAIAAHELRTPVTLLIGYSGRLLRRIDRGEVIGSEQREDVELLYSESLRLRRAMEIYLTLADVEMRSQAPAIELVDLVAAARSAVAEVSERFPAAVIRVQPGSGTLHWETDDVAIRRVVSNLVENAVKYSVAGAEILVSVGIDGAAATLSVRDRCGGLSAEDFRRLFGRSVRGKHGRVGQGLGLGLYVSQRLADRVGGSLRAENAEGGCVFTFRIPARLSSPERGGEDDW